jgi:DNA-binding CsgD family transcriptional regulator
MMVMAHRYTSAVLAPDDEAERRYAEAVALLPPGPRLVRARLHLQHGRWLRRQHRDLDAAEPLHTARAEFDRMGARPWADMTTSELCAIGEPTRPRVPQPSELLSARELQIAELAARGLSNRQIGRRLFLSQRTIAAYLNRIYPLLGITGRCKLADALSQH